MTTMRFALSFASSLIVLLSGCASEQVKDSSAPAPAPVPQASTPAPQASTPAPQAASQPRATAVVPSPSAVNPLHDPSNILAKRSIHYDFDQYDIKSEYRPIVEAHGAYLRGHSASTIRIEGNADERGSREYNLALGQRRADSVKRVLQLMGIADQRIETISWGEEKPKPAGHDEAAWAQHRRSDIIYTQE